MAVENERGNPANPLKITWLEGSSPKVHNYVPEDSSSTMANTSVNVRNYIFYCCFVSGAISFSGVICCLFSTWINY